MPTTITSLEIIAFLKDYYSEYMSISNKTESKLHLNEDI